MQHFPPTGRKWAVSAEGGMRPRWSGDGRELFFRSGPKMMVAAVTTGTAFAAGAPRVLFEGDFALDYDVTRDGQRFLMLQEKTAVPQLEVVLNWFDDVKRRVEKELAQTNAAISRGAESFVFLMELIGIESTTSCDCELNVMSHRVSLVRSRAAPPKLPIPATRTFSGKK